jgi:hypothetical protein
VTEPFVLNLNVTRISLFVTLGVHGSLTCIAMPQRNACELCRSARVRLCVFVFVFVCTQACFCACVRVLKLVCVCLRVRACVRV